jgi:hypothetical protein
MNPTTYNGAFIGVSTTFKIDTPNNTNLRESIDEGDSIKD